MIPLQRGGYNNEGARWPVLEYGCENIGVCTIFWAIYAHMCVAPRAHIGVTVFHECVTPSFLEGNNTDLPNVKEFGMWSSRNKKWRGNKTDLDQYIRITDGTSIGVIVIYVLGIE